MITVYFAEDDETISGAVQDFLGQRGYQVTVYDTIAKAKQAMRDACPALVLVDWNMPDGNGNMFCQWIRAKWRELPIIFLTVRGDVRDMVSGFQNGADDYIVKPFELDVLLLRIQALLRRAGDVSMQYLSCGQLSIDQNKRQVFCGAKEVALTPSEYQLLLCLMKNKGKIVTRKRLLEEIWDSNGNYVNDNTLTVTMKRLREKLHQPSCVKTVRSVGYYLEEKHV